MSRIVVSALTFFIIAISSSILFAASDENVVLLLTFDNDTVNYPSLNHRFRKGLEKASAREVGD